MTERIRSLLERTFDKEQAKFRRNVDWKPLLKAFIDEKIDDETRARMGLEAMLAAEEPAFMAGETIHFLRTVKQIPDLHSDEEMEARRKAGTAFGEKGVVFNLTADFGPTIRDGLDKRLETMKALVFQYYANGGLMIQFNVFDAEELKDAQRHPEKYENLQVRVCGWNVRWNDLPKVEQDKYILRAEALPAGYRFNR